jgi:hypothetical protein
MTRPVLLATKANNETFAGITYHLDGELVPALTVELLQGQSIFLNITYYFGSIRVLE